MDSTWQRIVDNLIGRVTGPMHFRLYLQPTMALLLGIRDGVKDYHEGRPPYFWSIFTSPVHRAELLKSGLTSVARVLILGVVMDAIYQYIEFRAFYPGEAVIVALILAFLPYLFIRGPVNRLLRWWNSRQPRGRQGVYKVSK
jgi:hypothetical protein